MVHQMFRPQLLCASSTACTIMVLYYHLGQSPHSSVSLHLGLSLPFEASGWACAAGLSRGLGVQRRGWGEPCPRWVPGDPACSLEYGQVLPVTATLLLAFFNGSLHVCVRCIGAAVAAGVRGGVWGGVGCP